MQYAKTKEYSRTGMPALEHDFHTLPSGVDRRSSGGERRGHGGVRTLAPCHSATATATPAVVVVGHGYTYI